MGNFAKSLDGIENIYVLDGVTLKFLDYIKNHLPSEKEPTAEILTTVLIAARSDMIVNGCKFSPYGTYWPKEGFSDEERKTVLSNGQTVLKVFREVCDKKFYSELSSYCKSLMKWEVDSSPLKKVKPAFEKPVDKEDSKRPAYIVAALDWWCEALECGANKYLTFRNELALEILKSKNSDIEARKKTSDGRGWVVKVSTEYVRKIASRVYKGSGEMDSLNFSEYLFANMLIDEKTVRVSERYGEPLTIIYKTP